MEFLNRQIILYAFIGFSGLFLDMALFALFTEVLEWNYQWSNWLSTSVGITNNFLLNAYFNFKKKDQLLWRYVKFYLIGCAGIGLTAVLLFLGVELLGGPPLVVKALSVVFVFIMQYGLNKRFSFK